MAMETRVQIRRRVAGDEVGRPADLYLRRDYTVYQEYQTLSLTSGVKTGLTTILTDIEYIYIRVTGDDATISLSKSLSPESIEFNDCFLFIGGEGVTSLALEADADTEVYVYIAGS